MEHKNSAHGLEWTGEKPVICREITFLEGVYEDGVRAIVDIRSKCFHPSGQPIPFLEGAKIARDLRRAAATREITYPFLSTLFQVFECWLLEDFEERLKSLEGLSCIHLDEKSCCQPFLTRHSPRVRNDNALKCAPKCNVP
jgi:hypothetical protein